MTHIKNLAGIVQEGAIRAYNFMRGRSYRNLSNDDVQQGRAGITVPASGRPLHDYTPLYFGFKTPMVAWNQAHNEELIFLRFSLNILAEDGVIITDGNARSTGTQFRRFQSLDDLSILDVRAVNSVRYASDSEMKRKKQAEILFPDAISFSNVLDIICFSTTAQNRVLAILAKSGMKMSVKVNPGWYFTPSGSQGSRTTGA
jgi:hypothetical protein